MSAQPMWSPVDDETADLLTLVADAGHVSADYEWSVFEDAVKSVAHANGGYVDQNVVRPLIRGKIAPPRIGAFWRRACVEGWLRHDGYSISDDKAGHNAGRPMRVYVLVGASA